MDRILNELQLLGGLERGFGDVLGAPQSGPLLFECVANGGLYVFRPYGVERRQPVIFEQRIFQRESRPKERNLAQCGGFVDRPGKAQEPGKRYFSW